MSPSAAQEVPRTAAQQALFPWPTPPYASYRDDSGGVQAWPCEVEGSNGQTRQCLLMSMTPANRVALIQVPPANVNMPLRFSMFRRISLKMPLKPVTQAVDEDGFALSELLDYRQRVQYRLQLSDGSTVDGDTIGHVETSAGLFLFHPLDDFDTVERVFYPKEAYQQVQLGESIGRVLVEQHVVTEEQVERAAAEQENLRSRKLGDYLVIKEIVSPEQLLQALEQQSKMPMVRIGEALTALGLISDGQLKDALDKQKTERTVPLGELLVKSGQLSRQDLQTALARKMGFPVVDVASFPIEADALRKVPFAMAKRLKVLPLLCRDGVLIVAAEDPSKRTTIEEIEFTTQNKVVAALAGVSQLTQALPMAYGKFGLDASKVLGMPGRNDTEQEPASADKLLESLEQQSSFNELADSEPLIEQSDNSLVRLINTMIVDACNQGASDIHIETYPTRRKVRIRFRRDGHLAPYMELPHTYRAALVARIKIMCDLDISERRKPQDGKIEFAKFSSQYPVELRVATVPTQGGAEDVVMRLLTSAKPLPMPELGLTAPNLAQLKDAVERPYGMVLCVGPTGSGKTTTLHAILQHLNTPQRKIWTAEDPIEITNPDLRQVQVNAKIDWTFAKALRSFLRADPDIIMVGEIRDQETAQVAIEASLTGHLVLSTLHTNSAPETVLRLLDMGMDPFNFSDSLLAVVAQRLVRQFCNECKKTEVASDEHVDELVRDYLRAFPADLRPEAEAVKADWTQTYGRNGNLLRCHAPGCSRCDNTGFKGRMGLHELMVNGPELRRLIQTHTHSRPEELQHEAMRHSHFRTLRQDGIQKVLAGLTSIDEVRANCN
ncbi:GspE/PulE family protein [Hydrogenophaga sp. OTU3427]|uniref:GspE/PulE family protein n=1 Tax=Hydrogenophaga sp. OTU3427 TaxID=3043856 RepID=UPI00313D2F29